MCVCVCVCVRACVHPVLIGGHRKSIIKLFTLHESACLATEDTELGKPECILNWADQNVALQSFHLSVGI